MDARISRMLVPLGMALVLLVGCSALKETLGMYTPKTVDEGVAAGYVTLTALNNSVADAAPVLGKTRSERLSTALDNAGVYLRDAKEMVQQDQLEFASDYLQLAEEVFSVVQKELAAAGK